MSLASYGGGLRPPGNIPGRTQTAAIAIFNYAEAMNYGAAQRLSVTLLAGCFALLLIVYAANRRLRDAVVIA